MSAARFDRWIGFVSFVLSRRTPTSIDAICEGTGYSRANVYRLVGAMQRHFPVDVKDGLVTMRRHIELPKRNQA